MKAVELEAKSTTSEALHPSSSFLTSRESKREAKREWREAHEKELKERRLRGITEKNAYRIDFKLDSRHLLETSEMAQKRSESKKEKERNRVLNYGWNIFGQVLLLERTHSLKDAIYRGYEKRLKTLQTTPESAAKAEEDYDGLLDYGSNSHLSKETIDRLVEGQKKQDEKHSQFSKRRTLWVVMSWDDV